MSRKPERKATTDNSSVVDLRGQDLLSTQRFEGEVTIHVGGRRAFFRSPLAVRPIEPGRGIDDSAGQFSHMLVAQVTHAQHEKIEQSLEVSLGEPRDAEAHHDEDIPKHAAGRRRLLVAEVARMFEELRDPLAETVDVRHWRKYFIDRAKALNVEVPKSLAELIFSDRPDTKQLQQSIHALQKATSKDLDENVAPIDTYIVKEGVLTTNNLSNTLRTLADQFDAGASPDPEIIRTAVASLQGKSAVNDDQIAEQIASLAPRQTPPPKLPKIPPETWETRDLNKRENPIQFLKRVYSPWMVDGFRMRQIRPLDSALYKACSVWVHRHPEDRIDEPPPPKASMADMIEQLSQHLSDQDLRRLGYAIDAHCRKKAKACAPS